MSDYPYSVGEELHNADWPKASTWEFVDEKGKITRGVDRLLRHMMLDQEEEGVQRAELRKFLRLPAAKPMPKQLREEVDRFIREGRTRDASR